MEFHKEISKWIIEYLLREATDINSMTQALSILPTPSDSPLLTKTISLKTIDFFILDGYVNESILDILERVAKIYKDEDGLVPFESIKVAYCMVAVDCTVKFYEGTGNGDGPYLEAVERIWKQRIGNLEKSSIADLMSDQLRTWRDDIEAAVYDDCISKRIMAINTRLEAFKALRIFSTKAWKLMGPTFLENVAKRMDRSLLVPCRNLSDCNDSNPVQEASPHVSDMHNLAGVRVVEKETNSGCMKLPDTPVPIHILRDKAKARKTAASSPPKAPVTKRNHRYQDRSTYFQDCDGSSQKARQTENLSDHQNVRDMDQNAEEIVAAVLPALALKHKGDSKQSKIGVQIDDAEDLTIKTLRNKVSLLDSAKVSEMQEALRSSSLGLQEMVKDPLPEVLSLIDSVISSLGMTPIKAGPSAENQDGMDVNMPNHSNAHCAEAVQTKEKNDGKGDDTHFDDRAPGSFVSKNTEVVLHSGDNIETKRSYPDINATREGFMTRNGTAQTYQWEETDDPDSPRPRSSKRLRLPRPEAIAVSPLKTYVGKRRLSRKWSSEEKDALRNGVQKFGKGRWKMIFSAYPEIFEARTEVDLKDKWRNLEKNHAVLSTKI